jgi:hypothetical protein
MRPKELFMPRVTEEAWLCRASEGNFVVDLDGKTISTTSVPSYALFMSYEKACQMVQYLRRRSYRQAVVTDYLGQPVSADSLSEALRTQQADPAAEPLPQTWADYHTLSSATMKRRMREPAFAAAIQKILATPEPAKARSRQ